MNDEFDDRDVDLNAVTFIKYFYSTAILIFSVVNVMVLIFGDSSRIAHDSYAELACACVWIPIIFLFFLEGSQAALSGLPSIDRELYRVNHPIAHRITGFVHKGDNLDRYLMGRQFMVVLCIYVINLAAAPVMKLDTEPAVFGWPSLYQDIFLTSGLAMIFMTAMIGQLTAQVNASHCMLDFINNYFAFLTVYVAMAIEFSGIMHVSYIIQSLVAKIAGKKIRSKEEPLTTVAWIFFILRCLISLAIVGFGFTVTFISLLDEKTTLWGKIPGWGGIILFFGLILIAGILEGMQIAFFGLAKMPKDKRGANKYVTKTCKLLFRGNGHNLPGFMVGRQLLVVGCYFIIARITTQNVDVNDSKSDNVIGVSDGFQQFMNTGLHAVVITTIFASISWQLFASAFPFLFLSNPLTYMLLRICLLIEVTGICVSSWALAALHKCISGFQYDEIYVGTPEERACEESGFVEESIHCEIGHLVGSSFPSGTQKVGLHDMDLKHWEDTNHSKDAEPVKVSETVKESA